ncbi:MAG: hypothetical protein IPJ61_20790 [Tessaracoccus sp.]|uniref:hypothetical protein n=1 Tax=Tessaracoccus sp. TaxID=1971211 RepID=UPI001EC7FD85|nr:hypothetical protein [Tessaracoccus sp.]MBK7823427.1 hypothetical protein [Tessaracoccus sp.]
MSLLSRPKLIHWQRDALNGMSPSSSFYAKVVEAENHLTAYRHRCVYRRAWMLGNAAYGYAGTTTLARFRFRSGHGVTGARVMLIMGRDNTGATATTPYASVTIGATTAGPFYYGQNPTASDDAPDDMILVADTIAISSDTTYSCSITTGDYARVMAACIYEVGADTVDEATEWFNATIPQAGRRSDAFQGRILQGLSRCTGTTPGRS